MSWIHVNIANSTVTVAPPSPGLPPAFSYRVSAEIVLTSGIPTELFVYGVTDDEFDHVATVFDLETYPTNKVDAIDDGLFFYRVKKMSKDFADKSTAGLVAEHTQLRLQRVNKDWQGLQPGSFDSVAQFTYDSGDA